MVGKDMKKFLILGIVITILLVSIVVSAQVALATAHPLRPGHAIFPLQDFAEQARSQFTFGNAE